MDSLRQRIFNWAIPCFVFLVASTLLGVRSARAQQTGWVCGTAYTVNNYPCGDFFPDCNVTVTFNIIYTSSNQGPDEGFQSQQLLCCGEMPEVDATDVCLQCCMSVRPQSDAGVANGTEKHAQAFADRGQVPPSSPPVPERSPLTIYYRNACTGEYYLLIAPSPVT